ncbi:MAG TPA: FtsX-like permease family protein [Bryobacterales bacterium]|nr:FtsX-like permease family protein [Bryobacterales bacterium]
MSFETFVARRYLRAKRKERFISLVTLLSVVGVATGVAALVIALAINNGVEQDLQRYLLGATAHVQLLEKQRNRIEKWPEFIAEFDNVDGVAAAAPALYGEVMITTPVRSGFAYLKGIDLERELDVVGMLNNLKEGSVSDLERPDDFPGIILGKNLAEHIGARLETLVTVINPQGEMTPFGPVTGEKRFRVAGIMDSGFFLYDNQWAVATLKSTQQALNVGDVINAVEFKLDDLDNAEQVAERLQVIAGDNFGTTNWKDQNRSLFQALEVEKLVTAITIGLIMLVAALNILTSLVMMVMEKRKGIAILKSLGATAAQVRKIFVLQGMIIGATGTAAGLVLGHILAWVCNAYKLIPLEAEVYGLSHVPMAPQLLDGILVGASALLMSYLTTIYPSSSATRIAPAHVLRYE